jgi:N utilization substance protein A
MDPAKYVCNALAPAEISRVIIDETNRTMEVIVPDEYLSIAIGKRGQNVRLASRLTGWHLDVKSETKYSETMQSGYDSLVSLPGVGISMADTLYEKGFFSAEEISNATIEDLVQIRGIGEETANKLIIAAQDVISAEAEEDLLEEVADQDTGEIEEEAGGADEETGAGEKEAGGAEEAAGAAKEAAGATDEDKNDAVEETIVSNESAGK